MPSSNPVQAHQRALRKKELKRNKTKRLAARDAKVASERTVSSVSAEIATLEKKKEYQNDHLDNTDTRALERLRKELRICQAAEAARLAQAESDRQKALEDEAVRRQQYAASDQAVMDANVAKFGTLGSTTAQMSIYYDAVMNPYGAAPPGKPMVYHARGGGTTMDVRWAVLPPELRETEMKEGKQNAGKEVEKGEGEDDKKRRRRKWDDDGRAAPANNGGASALSNAASITLSCPQQVVGRIIGRQGTTIKDIQSKSRCRVEIRQQAQQMQTKSSGDGNDHNQQQQQQPKPGEALVVISGERANVDIAKRMVEDIILQAQAQIQAQGQGQGQMHNQAQFQRTAPPPPPPRQLQQKQGMMQQQQGGAPPPPPPPPGRHMNGTGQDNSHNANHGVQPPPPPPLPPQPPPPPPPKPSQGASLPPALPAPSASVQRLAKQKKTAGSKSKRAAAMADIWATEEEIAYEESAAGSGSGDGGIGGGAYAIEGEVQTSGPAGASHQNQSNSKLHHRKHSKPSNKNNNPDADLYDPCCPSADGYADYRDGEQITRGAAAQKQTKKKKKKKKKGKQETGTATGATTPPLVDRWYYQDNQTGTVQGPFSSDQMVQWNGAGFFPPTTPMRNGEAGDFVPLASVDLAAPLRRPSDVIAAQGSADKKNNGIATASEDVEDGIEARIAALKGSAPPENANEEAPVFTERGENNGEEASPYPDVVAEEGGGGVAPAYGAIEAYDAEPPAYPLDDDEAGEIPYPEDVPYPVDDAYPIDDEAGAYPDTDAAYGQAHDGYPAVAPYYTGEEVPAYPLQEGEDVVPPTDAAVDAKPTLKEYKGDAAVVGFVPSNLAVKRTNKEVGETSRKRRKPNGATVTKEDVPEDESSAEPQGKSVAENYDDFMKQVAALK